MRSTRALTVCAFLLVASAAFGQDGVGRPLPFSDDLAPPPPLPVPLDRAFAGELAAFDGARVTLRWDWSDASHLGDFDAFVPVRHGLQGGFTIEDGRLVARGTAGVRVRLGLLDDLTVKAAAELLVPHDLGVVLAKPDVSDESIVCLVQDRLFTRFDEFAGNANMINKIGGIPATAPGVTEFRYAARSKPPALSRGDRVQLEVVRTGPSTRFTITPAGRAAVTMTGKDPDTPMTRFTPGLYVSGGEASFGTLEISGAIDTAWCASHDVLPHVAGDLLHPGNGFKGPVRKAAETVERYLSQDAASEESDAGAAESGAASKKDERVTTSAVAALVGRVDLPLVIRIRAAEALMEVGTADGTVVDRIGELLMSADRPARILAWQVLRPQLPWHFHYEPDAPAEQRREAALLIGHYFRESGDAVAMGKIFVEGYWHTPSRADAACEEWAHAWDWRSPRVRLRTNLPREWAVWYFNALEAAYAEMVRVVGREPPPEKLPLSVLVFRTDDDFETFCAANGYAEKSGWGRFTDLDRGVAFVTFEKQSAPHWTTGQMARLFLHRATGRHWPTWFDEGRSAWFGNPTYGTAVWDGTTLEVGRVAEGHEAQVLRAAAHAGDLPGVEVFLGEDPRSLDREARRRWYAQTWALHHWFMREAPEDLRARFGRWQEALISREISPRDVNAEGRRLFLTIFAGKTRQLEAAFLDWVKRL